MSKTKEYPIHNQADLVIDSECVKKLVPVQYRKFQKVLSETKLNCPDDYGLTALSVDDCLKYPGYDNATMSVKRNVKEVFKFNARVPDALLKLAKALAAIKAAAFNKKIWLNIGYECTDDGTKFRFGLPTNYYDVKFNHVGKNAVCALNPTEIRLTTDVCF